MIFDFDLGRDNRQFVTFTDDGPPHEGARHRKRCNRCISGGARARSTRADDIGARPKAGQPKRKTRADDQTGVFGEAAVAQVFDWDDTWNPWDPAEFARRFEGDVAGLEVRSSDPRGNLLVRPHDPPSRIYVHCRVHQRPESTRVELIGWNYGDEAQQPEFARQPDNGRPPVYIVPPERLRPMRELWQLLEGRPA